MLCLVVAVGVVVVVVVVVVIVSVSIIANKALGNTISTKDGSGAPIEVP